MKPNNDDDVDMQLLMNAMTTTAGRSNPTYQLPEPVMRRYAQLLREDERERCADRAVGFMITRGQDLRDLTAELVDHIMMAKGESK